MLPERRGRKILCGAVDGELYEEEDDASMIYDGFDVWSGGQLGSVLCIKSSTIDSASQ